ncbi:hypothetical protein [Clostridium sp. BNL1100]|uniref:hypothetical protein n=1 Tax=Clostridium sp. BNL1100 TaxID=755731 RepID=UPI00024A775B|nr:hypothetical protein [Clostridium sp. BNL1100]AEY67834.1 hypothetical protein Clo1100_3715 [Clostridium sp. BNL1100]
MEKMSDYEYWEKEQFLAKMNNKHWIEIMNKLKNIVIDDNKTYAVVYIPFKGRKEQKNYFTKSEFIPNSRIGIFTFDDKMTLPDVEIVDFLVEEKQDLEDYFKELNKLR